VQPPLQSAYKVFDGTEPNFTNYSKVRDEPVFIDTLDYIFFSPEWRVENVQELPHSKEVAGPFPNETEYSDHLMISAEMYLEGK
jgi:2',5'-phosphodiesterase